MTHEFIFSGFGGQGVMLMGQLIIQAGLEEGRQVSWIPSYGPEMRGGTAFCSVIISDEPIGCPVVSEPTLVMAMNLPSKDRFEDQVRPSGSLIVNSSLVHWEPRRSDINNCQVPLNDLAMELGNQKLINMAALGAVCAAAGPVAEESVFKAMGKLFGKKALDNPEMMEKNKSAFKAGFDHLRPVALTA